MHFSSISTHPILTPDALFYNYNNYVRAFKKGGGGALLTFVDFELVVLSGSTVDELFVALCCTSIAAPIPKIHLLKV